MFSADTAVFFILFVSLIRGSDFTSFPTGLFLGRRREKCVVQAFGFVRFSLCQYRQTIFPSHDPLFSPLAIAALPESPAKSLMLWEASFFLKLVAPPPDFGVGCCVELFWHLPLLFLNKTPLFPFHLLRGLKFSDDIGLSKICPLLP